MTIDDYYSGLGVGLATGDGYCSAYEVDYDYCGSSYVIGR